MAVTWLSWDSSLCGAAKLMQSQAMLLHPLLRPWHSTACSHAIMEQSLLRFLHLAVPHDFTPHLVGLKGYCIKLKFGSRNGSSRGLIWGLWFIIAGGASIWGAIQTRRVQRSETCLPCLPTIYASSSKKHAGNRRQPRCPRQDQWWIHTGCQGNRNMRINVSACVIMYCR